MASKKQIEANRLNSQKSTGPRTDKGKAQSSQNALKTGIHAKSQIVRGESETALETLAAEYFDRYRPTTPAQRMLVDTLIDSEWLLRRFRKVEAHIWAYGADLVMTPVAEFALAQAYGTSIDAFSHLQRRIDSTHRTYRNTLHELQRLQAEEAAALQAESEAEPDPASPTIQTTKLPNGFVPQKPLAQAISPANPGSPEHSGPPREALLP